MKVQVALFGTNTDMVEQMIGRDVESSKILYVNLWDCRVRFSFEIFSSQHPEAQAILPEAKAVPIVYNISTDMNIKSTHPSI